MITVKNRHHKQTSVDDIYIGRGSALGNPFTHLPGTTAPYVVATREEAVAAYEKWLQEQLAAGNQKICDALNMIANISLEGRPVNLVCFCAPKLCHGDVIKKLIDQAVKDELSKTR